MRGGKRAKKDEQLQPDGWPYGSRFMVYNVKFKAWYLGQIVQCKADTVRIRYIGWGSSDDEWVPTKSDRFDVESGGRKRWKPVAGAAGAFLRLDGGALPNGSMVTWPPPLKPMRKRKAPELAACEVASPNAGAERDEASSDHEVIHNIRAFGATSLEPAPERESYEAYDNHASADKGAANPAPAREGRYTRRSPGGAGVRGELPVSLAVRQHAAGDALDQDAGVHQEERDGKRSHGADPSGNAAHEPPALGACAANGGAPSEAGQGRGRADGHRSSGSSRECNSKGEHQRKPSRTTQVASLHHSSQRSKGSGKHGDSDSAAAGGLEHPAPNLEGEGDAAAASRQEHVPQLLGGLSRAPRHRSSQVLGLRHQQSSAGAVSGLEVGAGPGQPDVLWRALELARKQQLALEWTLLQLDAMLRDHGLSSPSGHCPPYLDATAFQPGKHDVWQECQHLEVLSTWQQQAIGKRIRLLKAGAAAHEPAALASAAAASPPQASAAAQQMLQMQLDLAPVLAVWQGPDAAAPMQL